MRNIEKEMLPDVDVGSAGLISEDGLAMNGSLGRVFEWFVAPCELLSDEVNGLFSRLFKTKLSFDPSVNL